jgi:hypothetical protein
MQKTTIPILTLLLLLSVSSLVAVQIANADVIPAENWWTTKASMHIERSCLGVAEVNGKIYAIGGINVASVLDMNAHSSFPVFTGGSVVGTNEEYDPSTNTWSFKAEMPQAQAGFAIAVVQNKIYCIGDIFHQVYDTANNTWELQKSPPLHFEAATRQANVVNGKIYFLGNGPNYVYNPETNSWSNVTRMSNAPNGRQASCVYGNKIFVLGSPCIQIYDPQNDGWTTSLPIHVALTQPIAVATSGIDAPAKIYLFQKGTVTSYNPQSESWTDGADLPDREGYGVAVCNDIMYVVGGETGDIYAKNELSVNQQYFPFGYGTVPPKISVASPTNERYSSRNVTLNFTINKPVNWVGYSLDAQQNVTLTGNSTVVNLANRFHNLTVYATDKFGNEGASENVTFQVEAPEPSEPFPTAVVAVFSGVVGAVIVACLIVYSKRYKRQNKLLRH